ncbi:hypothetical protein KR100_07220 [Synechococcus sp. KORDI-100]|nr:hypothetical protein KR100_07220 [Synechococcus sp. KORDI-100]
MPDEIKTKNANRSFIVVSNHKNSELRPIGQADSPRSSYPIIHRI